MARGRACLQRGAGGARARALAEGRRPREGAGRYGSAGASPSCPQSADKGVGTTEAVGGIRVMGWCLVFAVGHVGRRQALGKPS